ncbi:MAG: DNA adenine methylase [Planctomycetes bacterium]|nr:DNA adenine methylase [Planctomycetota bacterium]
MSFPDTKYMGSKQAILPFIISHIRPLSFSSAMDAFSGSGCVAYAMKRLGKRVTANDFHRFAYHIAKTTVENNSITLSANILAMLLRRNPKSKTFVKDTFTGLYFKEEDCDFIDNTYANIRDLTNETHQSLALAALCRACMKKRPRGIFTFVGNKGRDGRRDLKISLKQQFLEAIPLFNQAVFSNHQRNKATCSDVFDLSPKGVDLVYIDPPYMSPHSDCDYTRRYHFIEGLCSYWKGLILQAHTVTKKIHSYPTAFKNTRTACDAFSRLFDHFKNCILVVSYGSNGIPGREEMVRLLRQFKKQVRVYETTHKYCFGNHHHKVGQNNNDVSEYLFIAV